MVCRSSRWVTDLGLYVMSFNMCKAVQDLGEIYSAAWYTELPNLYISQRGLVESASEPRYDHRVGLGKFVRRCAVRTKEGCSSVSPAARTMIGEVALSPRSG